MSLARLDGRSPATALRSPWLPFGVAVVAAWVLLARAHLAAPALGPLSRPATLVGLWAVMSVAMMAPTAVPVLASLREITARSSARPWWAFLVGYLVVWLGFSLVAGLAQYGLTGLGLLDGAGRSVDRWLTGGLLLVAGAYQFSTLKQRCVTSCAAPMTFFLRHWRGGASGGLRMGLRSGVTCLGCCWALMLLAFVGGVHSLAFMALATVVMAVEKLPGLSRYLTVPLGVLLTGAGLATLLGLLGPLGGPGAEHHEHDEHHTMGAARMEEAWTPGRSPVS